VALARLSVDGTGAGGGVELAKLLSVIPAGISGVRFRYEIDARIDLGSPGDVATVEFTGDASDYAPLKTAVDQLLRSHQAVLKASLIATFDPPVPASGQEIEDVRRRAADTGPAKCTVTFLTEEHP
jgi:hypothetical protein